MMPRQDKSSHLLDKMFKDGIATAQQILDAADDPNPSALTRLERSTLTGIANHAKTDKQDCA